MIDSESVARSVADVALTEVPVLPWMYALMVSAIVFWAPAPAPEAPMPTVPPATATEPAITVARIEPVLLAVSDSAPVAVMVES